LNGGVNPLPHGPSTGVQCHTLRNTVPISLSAHIKLNGLRLRRRINALAEKPYRNKPSVSPCAKKNAKFLLKSDDFV
jgi:hypothetical protein